MSRVFFAFVLTVFCLFKVEAINLQSGDCTDIGDKNLAHYEEVKKYYHILARQYHVVNYSGVKPIKCIKAVDEWDNSSDIMIEDGGIGRNFTSLKITSRISRGINYKVYIYTDDTGAITNSPIFDNTFLIDPRSGGNSSDHEEIN